jgi:hypothetical protein
MAAQIQRSMTDRDMQSEQRVQSGEQRTIQKAPFSSGAVPRPQSVLPELSWPTSRPGPLAIEPPSGQRPINLLRREQMVEVGYS